GGGAFCAVEFAVRAVVVAVDGVEFGGRAEELGEGGLVKFFRNLLLLAIAVLTLPFGMTSSICHPRFLWAWNEMGQCGASDPPSEVFLAFLAISIFIWFIVFVVIWLTGFATRKSA
ncbi:MAG: hypothetical protein ACSHWY_02815, partial [Octadecabacter sp.]